MTHEERMVLFRERLPFFGMLSDDTQAALCRRTVSLTLTGSEVLCGMRGRCIGLLLPTRGRARAYLRSEEGREITLCRLSAGDVFVMPSSGLFGIDPFDVALESEGHLSAELIDPRVVDELLGGCREAEIFFLRTTVGWFSEAMRSVRSVLLDSLERRLAAFLIREVDRHGGDTVYLTQDEIAKQIGSAREAVSRTLKAFAARELVVVLRGGVKLRDAAALRALLP